MGGYFVALAGTAVAVAIRLYLPGWTGSRLAAFGILYASVVWASGFKSARPALFATLLGCLTIEFLVVSADEGMLRPAVFPGVWIVAIYVIPCCLIILLAERGRRALRQAESLESAMVAKQRRLGAEIADKEAAEAEAKHQAERFRTMADSAPVLIWMSGQDRKLNWYNKPWLEFVGRTLEEEQGADWGENIHDLDYDAATQAYDRAFRAHEPFNLEYRLRRHDGKYRWVIDNGVPLYDAKGQFNGFIGSCIDITDRKEAEDLARAADEKAAHVIENLADAFVSLDKEHRYSYVNAAAERHYGKKREEMLGKTPWEVFPEYRDEKNQALLKDLLDDTGPKQIETFSVVTNRWVQSNSYPTAEGISYFIRDVTEAKQSAEAIESKEALLRLITNALPALISYVDSKGIYRLNNRAYGEWFQVDSEDLAGKHLSEVLGPELFAIAKPYMEKALAGEEVQYEVLATRPDGQKRWVKALYTPDTGPNGEVRGYVTLIHDITDQKKAVEALEVSEARFQSFMDYSPALSWIKDADGRYIFINKALQDLNGWQAGDWHGKTDFELYPKELAAVYRSNDEIVLGDGRVRQFNESVYEDGKTKQLLAIKFPMRSGDGSWQIGGMAIDVTESIRAEEALRASEARFQAFMEFSPAISWIKNQKGQYVFVNRAMRKMFGWSVNECSQKTDSELFATEIADRLRRHDLAVLEKGDVLEFVEVLPSTSGPRHFLIVSFPMRVGEGQWHVAGKGIDITDRVHAEEALSRSERELNEFFENAAIGIQWVGPTGIVQRANRTILEMLGYSRGEYIGKHIRNFFAVPDELQRFQGTLESGEPLVNFSARLRAKDGSIRDILVNSNALLDHGEFVHSRSFLRDVTQEKRALLAVQDSEERFRVLAESIPSIVWTAAPDGTITYANRHWLEYCGLDPDESLGGWPEIVVHPEDFDRYVDKWTSSLKDGIEFDLEVRNRRFDGEYRWFMTRAVPIRDEEGKVKSWFGVTTDIHDQKMLQEQLQEADQRKDEFLAMLAHELRNPLAPIRNAVHLLQVDPSSTDGQRSSLDIIERQVSQMVRLVDDLLEASRMTRGKLELRLKETDIASVVENAMMSCRPILDSMNHEVQIELPEEPIVLMADPIRLSQIFSNLLNNAAKYTKPGGKIRIKAERLGDTAAISVRDTGVGIDPQHLRNIFDMFWQVSPALDRAGGGLGIGLSLVKSLVQLHGGTIEVYSEGKGQGSEFIVRLPLIRAGSQEPAPAVVQMQDSAPIDKLKILVVDDNADSAHTLSLLLQLMSHETETAGDGLEAIRMAEAHRPDVILLDIGLPEMNGYEVARRIRSEPWGAQMSLVALSGWGQDSDKQKASDAGFDVHLTKPVDFSTLENVLATLTIHRPSKPVT